MPYGLHFVQYTISNPKNQREIGYDYGFLKIVEGPLYVYIVKGSAGVYIEKRIITIDGSETYDPDFFATKGKLLRLQTNLCQYRLFIDSDRRE